MRKLVLESGAVSTILVCIVLALVFVIGVAAVFHVRHVRQLTPVVFEAADVAVQDLFNSLSEEQRKHLPEFLLAADIKPGDADCMWRECLVYFHVPGMDNGGLHVYLRGKGFGPLDFSSAPKDYEVLRIQLLGVSFPVKWTVQK